MIARLWTVSLLVALGLQGPRADGVKAWIEERAAAQQFSGVVLVAAGDRPVLDVAVGFADRKVSQPNTTATRFNLGSINKTFTAIAVAQLAQQGKLSFSDAIGKHLPDYPNRDAASTITIHHLLTHTSGLAPYTTGFGAGRPAASSAKDLVASFAAEPLRFPAGSRQEYSNAGYVLLGRIVEVVSGLDYSRYVTTRIYEPAGMRDAGFEPVPTNGPRIARGYVALGPDGRPMMIGPGGGRQRGGPPPPESRPSSDARPSTLGENGDMLEPGNPAGGGYSTAADLVAFARALRTGKLLDATMTDLLLNGTFSGAEQPKYGYALREEMVNGRRFVGNGGGAPGLNAELRFEPAGGLTVVVLSNYSPPSATRTLERVLSDVTSAVQP